MNIIEMEDMVKGLPDQLLMQEAQAPSGRIPQFLALSEVQRRKDMRDRFQQQAPQQTVKDMILGGTAGPPSPQPPPIPGGTQPGGAPPQPVMAYGGGRMPNMYADGGSISAGQQGEAVKQAFSGKARVQDFLQQNLMTPQGLGRLAAGALGTAVGGPLAGYAASQGFNRLFPMGPSALDKAAQNVQTANNPFGMYGQSFSDAGAARQAEMDQAGAMALGNRYQNYLNRMTNPFAGTGSGIVRDERLGDDSLNMGLGAFTGMAAGGVVKMQEGRTVPDFQNLVSLPQFGGNRSSNLLAIEELLKIPEELRTPEQNQIIASLLPAMQDFPVTPPPPQVPETIAAPAMAQTSATVAPPPAGAAPPAAPPGSTDSFMRYLPGVESMVSKMMPQAAGFDVAGYTEAFKPKESDYVSPEFKAAREKMITDLRTEAQKRREADMALAQRYMSEAEAPIKAAEEEAKKAALGAVLTRLGAGLMQGDAAAGLAMATESAEKIMGRSRELSQAERRAAKQEFRVAEREATRAERGSADQAFNMQAQNLLSDENAQRMYVRDSKNFAQSVYGLMRDAGKDARAAHMESVRLTFSIAQAIDTAEREAKREAGLTDRQYAQTFGTVFDNVIKALEDADFVDPKTGESRAPTGEELLDLANKKAGEILTTRGIRAPSQSVNAVRVTTQDELNKLASGTPYIYVGPGSDNKVRTKP